MNDVSVVVCIPTFRRPIGLRKCLESLAALEITIPLRVVVADNDPERQEGIGVCELMRAEGFRFPITVLTVSERGIPANRNALVAEAIADPATSLIAMLDDDEWASPVWLTELLRVQAECDADVVGGPVYRLFEVPVPGYIGRAHIAHYAKKGNGPIEFVDATSNILFRANLFRDRSPPWFDPDYGLMGGEDKDALLRFKIAGARFAWANAAIVTEIMPATRCSVKWMVRRAYLVGNSDTVMNLKRRPPGFNFPSELAKIAGALAVAAAKMTLFVWHPAIRFEGVRLGARVTGKMVALLGGRHEEYKVIHGR